VVTAPPEAYFESVRERDRQAAREFYSKFVDVQGLPVVAAAVVDDEALRRTHFLVSRLLAGRPDVLVAMVKNGTRLIIIGKDQVYTEMPEYRNSPVDPDFGRRRDKQQYELRVTRIDVEFDRKLESIFDEATKKGLWKGTPAARSRVEYLAAGVEAYFNLAGKGLSPELAGRPIATREELKAYDPNLFSLVEETMVYKDHADWRYGR
jgi:hypothetical protein